MAKRSGAKQTGGVTRSAVKSGPPRANVMSPGGVSQLGAHVGNHTTEGTIRGAKPQSLQRGTMPAQQLGNALATNVGKGGVGTGRTVYRAGSQSSTPSVTAPPKGTDILSQYGPERKIGR